MADEKVLYQICPSCGGDKLVDINVDNPNANDPIEWIEVECTRCNDDGMIPFGELNIDLITILADIKNVIDDIWEKINV